MREEYPEPSYRARKILEHAGNREARDVPVLLISQGTVVAAYNIPQSAVVIEAPHEDDVDQRISVTRYCNTDDDNSCVDATPEEFVYLNKEECI